MSYKPGSLNHLLRMSLPDSPASPAQHSPTLSSVPKDVQDDIVESLMSEKAKAIFQKRIIVAMMFTLVLNFAFIYWSAFFFHFKEVTEYALYSFPLYPIEFMLSKGKSYTFGSSFALIALIASFAYQSSWTRPNTGNPASRVWNYLKFHVLFPFWAFPLLAGLLARCYFGITGHPYSVPYRYGFKCGVQDMSSCLIERNLFVTFCAAFCALFFTIRFRLHHQNIIRFPGVGTTFLREFLLTIKKSLRESFYEGMMPIGIFYAIYFVQGDYLMESATQYYNLTHPERYPVARFSQIFNPELFMWTFGISTLTVAVLKIANYTFHLSATQRLKFPIEHEIYEEPRTKMLMAEAIGSKSYYLKYLACYDLKLIGTNLEDRLVDIFKLSHPGGNPTNWTSIFNPCMKIIEDAMKAVNSVLEAHRKSKIVEKIKDDYISDPWNPECKVLYSSLTPVSLHGDPFLHRRVAGQEIRSLANRAVDPICVDNRRKRTINPIIRFIANPAESFKFLLTKLSKGTQDQISTFLGQIKKINNPSPINSIVAELSHYTLLMWANVILTDIACASLIHDLNGAVQYSLSKLISTQIRFYQTMLEVQREATELGYSSASVSLTSVAKGKQSIYAQEVIEDLLKAYRFSLCRLYHHFFQYLTLIQIDADLVRKWKIAARRQDEKDIAKEKEYFERLYNNDLFDCM